MRPWAPARFTRYEREVWEELVRQNSTNWLGMIEPDMRPIHAEATRMVLEYRRRRKGSEIAKRPG